MNVFHRWYCNSGRWAKRLQGDYMPATLSGIELAGSDVLEVGPGPGMSTDWLRERAATVTSVEIDRKLADALKQRLANTNVRVIEADASTMPLPDAAFDTVVSFTMLHHVPAASQDRLLAECCRVLRPGGWFAGMDSTPNFVWNLYHLFDDRHPVDPASFGSRLAAAGFAEISVKPSGSGFGFRARKPA